MAEIEDMIDYPCSRTFLGYYEEKGLIPKYGFAEYDERLERGSYARHEEDNTGLLDRRVAQLERQQERIYQLLATHVMRQQVQIRKGGKKRLPKPTGPIEI